jgi:hypothetical protein
MSKTNTLTSHHGERNSSRIDKMSGMQKELKQLFVGESKKFWKRFFSKKRRQFLNQNNEEKL